MFPMLIAAGAGGLLSMNKAKKEAEAQRQMAIANAAAMRYSPWTGMRPQMMGVQAYDPLSSMGEGALRGASFAQANKGMFDKMGMGGGMGGGAAPMAEKPMLTNPSLPSEVEPTEDTVPDIGDTVSQNYMEDRFLRGKYKGRKQNDIGRSPWGSMSSRYMGA